MLFTSPVITKDIGEGRERRLLLRSDELRQIKRECGRGFYTLYSNFAENAEPDEVYQIIRLALIGGGLDPAEALAVAGYYARPPRPLKDVYILAYEVLDACWAGVRPEDKKDDGAPVNPEDVDEYFDLIEAKLARAGADTSVLKGKTFAEVREFLRLADKDAKDSKDGGPAPSQEEFDAIRRQARDMK